jgi:hypothetical protein
LASGKTSPALLTFESRNRYVEDFDELITKLASLFNPLPESETAVTETCYSKGQKVILVTSQIKNGNWLCTFSIPGFSHLDGGLHGQDSSKGHKTEWEARTNAFQRAKLFLDRSQDMTQGHIVERS